MPESPVRELRVALTVEDYAPSSSRIRSRRRGATATSGSARRDGIQLTLFTVLDE